MTIEVNRAGQVDRNSLFDPLTAVADLPRDAPLVMADGKSVRPKDIQGREYLDGMTGPWCVNLGYGRRKITDPIAAQSAKQSSFHASIACQATP